LITSNLHLNYPAVRSRPMLNPVTCLSGFRFSIFVGKARFGWTTSCARRSDIFVRYKFRANATVVFTDFEVQTFPISCYTVVFTDFEVHTFFTTFYSYFTANHFKFNKIFNHYHSKRFVMHNELGICHKKLKNLYNYW